MKVTVDISVISLDQNGKVLNEENLLLDKGTTVKKVRTMSDRFDLYRVVDGPNAGKYFCHVKNGMLIK